jgi:hypothetical protein
MSLFGATHHAEFYAATESAPDLAHPGQDRADRAVALRRLASCAMVAALPFLFMHPDVPAPPPDVLNQEPQLRPKLPSRIHAYPSAFFVTAPTRLYFAGQGPPASAGAARISPPYDAGWEDTANAGTRGRLVSKHINSSVAVRIVITETGETKRRLWRQYISDELVAQRIQGPIKGQVWCANDEADPDPTHGLVTIALKVVSCDGTVVRGTLLTIGSYGTYGLHPAGQYGNRILADNDQVMPVNALDGDRIVIEVGTQALSPETSDGYAVLTEFRESAAFDLPEDEVEPQAFNTWFEFLQTIAFRDPLPINQEPQIRRRPVPTVARQQAFFFQETPAAAAFTGQPEQPATQIPGRAPRRQQPAGIVVPEFQTSASFTGQPEQAVSQPGRSRQRAQASGSTFQEHPTDATSAAQIQPAAYQPRRATARAQQQAFFFQEHPGAGVVPRIHEPLEQPRQVPRGRAHLQTSLVFQEHPADAVSAAQIQTQAVPARRPQSRAHFAPAFFFQEDPAAAPFTAQVQDAVSQPIRIEAPRPLGGLFFQEQPGAGVVPQIHTHIGQSQRRVSGRPHLVAATAFHPQPIAASFTTQLHDAVSQPTPRPRRAAHLQPAFFFQFAPAIVQIPDQVQQPSRRAASRAHLQQSLFLERELAGGGEAALQAQIAQPAYRVASRAHLGPAAFFQGQPARVVEIQDPIAQPVHRDQRRPHLVPYFFVHEQTPPAVTPLSVRRQIGIGPVRGPIEIGSVRGSTEIGSVRASTNIGPVRQPATIGPVRFTVQIEETL